jgi:hypothetical protein
MNRSVVTVEYSSTREHETLPDGRSEMLLVTNWHKGHIFREYRPGFSNEANDATYIDLSFSALKGASGAPVVAEYSGEVLAMILSNVENQLMPTQVERTEWPDGTKDATFFLRLMQSELRT